MDTGLTVAVTGPTGTFGQALVPLLEADDRVERVVGIARRPFDPASRGWTKLEYRQGDVRDADALAEAFEGADVVVHLAFLIVGGGPGVTRAINVEGTLNTFRAAARAGVQRFVYASSVAAYGFHRDNPTGMGEHWPVRPADRLFYAQEKAELEHLLSDEGDEHPEVDMYLLRRRSCSARTPSAARARCPRCSGPSSRAWAPVGAASPRRASWASCPPWRRTSPCSSSTRTTWPRRCGCACWARARPGRTTSPGTASSRASTSSASSGCAGAAAGRPVAAAARLVSRLPLLPQRAQWVEALSHPAIMDTTKARTQLGWTPRHSALDCLRATLPQR